MQSHFKFLLIASFVAALVASLGPAVGFGFGFALAFAAWMYGAQRLARLERWLDDPEQPVPHGIGMWDDVFALLYRQRRAHQRQLHQVTNALLSFRRAAQALPEGVVTLTHDNHIAWCNANAASMLGLKLHTDTGAAITNLVRSPEFAHYLDQGDWSRPLSLRVMRDTARLYSIQLVEYGESQRLLLARDITQMDRLETMRRDFVANVSHELKTPLTVLAGFLETLIEHEMPPEQQRHFLNLMNDQATRMRHLVGDLLTLSALDAGTDAPRDASVELDPLLDKLAQMARSLSGGRHEFDFALEPGISLLGVEGEIASAFENLISNAIRYTPDGGTVRVRLFAPPAPEGQLPEVRFAVSDTGIGIAPQHIPRLTERFYRVDRGRSRETGGTGLGLAIVKHALSRHEAQLNITSEVGVGTTMTAVFPPQRVARVRREPARVA
ncbi:phosphate regulon sensor histidine kinase PhoR [Derxia gummosa]|uniref:Phosphate regulon sensor protein PhoR n=1 Tax=Derxia gummosa DSM 723 TaxID=1121388 RepID=A0A8B6X746_9BURK|nr:phosphate regulon sensor histidine kinase PhoR [Derxia gummosa]